MFKKLKMIFAWSFSRYSDYILCPLKAKLKHLDKIAEPPNEAMARGAGIHDLARDYLRGVIVKLPPELVKYKILFVVLRNRVKAGKALIIEESWAFRKDWSRTVWNDWAECWLRVKVDCAEITKGVMDIYDWKTGKFRVEEAATMYTEQLELYALAGFLLYPEVKRINATLLYLDAKAEYPMTFYRDQLPALQQTWLKRTRAMLNDKRFAPRPNNKCIWCFYRHSNKAAGGGQCRY
jgi:CRISPR/Cas system-associated exonuclease Cas4 (RecB family)